MRPPNSDVPVRLREQPAESPRSATRAATSPGYSQPMTVLSRGDRVRRSGRRPGWLLLTVLLVLAIAASSALVFTNRVELLKLAVILSLWAAVVGAFVSAIYRRQSDADQAKVRDLKMVYDLQLDREISARREYELNVETHLRRELAGEIRNQSSDEVAALRAELAALRTNLEILFDTDLAHRPAIETDRRFAEWTGDAAPPRPDRVSQQPRHGRSPRRRRAHRREPHHRRAGRAAGVHAAGPAAGQTRGCGGDREQLVPRLPSPAIGSRGDPLHPAGHRRDPTPLAATCAATPLAPGATAARSARRRRLVSAPVDAVDAASAAPGGDPAADVHPSERSGEWFGAGSRATGPALLGGRARCGPARHRSAAAATTDHGRSCPATPRRRRGGRHRRSVGRGSAGTIAAQRVIRGRPAPAPRGLSYPFRTV